MASQNIGQIAGLWIGTSAPTNTTLIWFDSTPAIRCHKVYNQAAGAWVVLDQSTISAITYSELKTLAKNVGLTQGSWYKITDTGNILALAITTTKVQYADVNSNFVIDDLAASATYVVSSNNLLIDDINGVWDATNKKLEFSFTETTYDGNSDGDYLFGKKKRNSVWSLAKYKLSALVSAVTGNALSWNKGIFFNFNKALSDKTDVSGGVVGKATYDADKATMQKSIDNASASNQTILSNAKEYTDTKTTDEQVYGKVLPVAPTSGTAVDIVKGDTLSAIVNKIYRWIAQLKVATGVKVSQSFTPYSEISSINNNDTVDSALRKVQKKLDSTPIIKSGEDVVSGTKEWETYTEPYFNYSESVFKTLSKLISKFKNIRRDNLQGGTWLMPVYRNSYDISIIGIVNVTLSDLIISGSIRPIFLTSTDSESLIVKITFQNIDNLIPLQYTRFQLFLFSESSSGQERSVELSFPYSTNEQIIPSYDFDLSISLTKSSFLSGPYGKIVTFERIKTYNGVYTWSIVSVTDFIHLTLSF